MKTTRTNRRVIEGKQIITFSKEEVLTLLLTAFLGRPPNKSESKRSTIHLRDYSCYPKDILDLVIQDLEE